MTFAALYAIAPVWLIESRSKFQALFFNIVDIGKLVYFACVPYNFAVLLGIGLNYSHSARIFQSFGSHFWLE